jgi:hypothetical protein
MGLANAQSNKVFGFNSKNDNNPDCGSFKRLPNGGHTASF